MPSPEQIAEQLVADWQAAGRMPPMAWDFLGFAAEAVRRASVCSERDLCAVQFAVHSLTAIADRKRMVGDVIEPLNDIRKASSLAKEAARRFGPVADKLMDAPLATAG